MDLDAIKAYLATRINAEDLLALDNVELTKYMTTSYNLLDTFYKIEDIQHSEDLVKVVSEEMIFLFNANIDLNIFYQYEGLTSFNVGKSAVQGSVDYSNKGDLFSPFVKAILSALGIEERIESPNSKVKTGFTWT